MPCIHKHSTFEEPALGLLDPIQLRSPKLHLRFREWLAMPHLLIAVSVGFTIFTLWKLAPLIFRSIYSPLRDLPGPPSPHWFYGHFKLISKEHSSVPQERWMEQYGTTLAYQGILGVCWGYHSSPFMLTLAPGSYIGCGQWILEH